MYVVRTYYICLLPMCFYFAGIYREFVREFVQFNGYEVDWSKVYVTALLEAMAASVYDTADLERVLNICITKNQ